MIFFKLLIFSSVALLTHSIDVKNLLSKLSIEDKCGQMAQVLLGIIEKAPNDPTYQENPVDIEKLRHLLKNYKLGSILGIPFGAPTLEQWHNIIKLVQDVALNETEHHIPIIYGTDSIHGAFIDKAVLFPHQLSLAATFNYDLVKNVSSVIAKETRASGIIWNFSPILDMGRQPLWPRLYETFGEDVHLASKLAEAYVLGHQGSGFKDRSTAATCLKHYVGYSYPINGRDRSIAWIPEILLREVFLPPYESGVRSGALSVMINSGDVNGVPGHSNYQYLTTILKGEWNFTGFTVSDFEDVKRLHIRDKIASTPEEAVYIAVMAGVDMNMLPVDLSYIDHCISLAKKFPDFAERINDATYRILHVKNELGLFDDPYPHASDMKEVATQESIDLNLLAAQESIILGKNSKNILPLEKNLKIFVTGPTSNLNSVLNAGWSYSWQGNNENDYNKFGRKKYTILEALRNRTTASQVTYVESVDFEQILNLDETIDAAEKADVIVLCIGESAYAETPGNINNLMISAAQRKVANLLFEVGKPVIVIYAGGRPRIITEIVERADAVVFAFLPGERGGEAIADIIFGNTNPSAKFPITYPREPNGYMTYDYRPIESPNFYTFGEKIPDHFDALFAFGDGLSYTQFKYTNLVINSTNVKPPNGIGGSLTVKNTGSRDGQEVVIVYLNDEYSHISRPVKQMKSFRKIQLKVNEERVVNFELSLKDMSFIGIDNTRVYERGTFNIYVADLTTKFYLECETKICQY